MPEDAPFAELQGRRDCRRRFDPRWEGVRHDIEPVCRPGQEPMFQSVGHLFRRAYDETVARFGYVS